ncbi:NAD(P)/FAD-dependent oxidoreductase [Hyphobacterium sp. CCMP332]|nr:NAD(P)/FAD-dependent oxidoreductase [Hyphobacterium sp. CCMP332]
MNNVDFDIIVIGGGAAGFFAAIHAADNGHSVCILEKTQKLLSKVKVSGGGRCNVMHDLDYPSQLVNYYPRGGKNLKKSFEIFGPKETRDWFEKRGLKLKTEEDGRVFPITDDSQTVIDLLLNEAQNRNVEIRKGVEIINIKKDSQLFVLDSKTGEKYFAKKVIISSGGNNKSSAYDWIRKLDINIAKPIPSLFTFNVPQSDMKDLMGLSVKKGSVQVPGTKWKMEGAILITHWGFSAPAVIKLSAWAAIDFFKKNYHFPILINWTPYGEEEIRLKLAEFRDNHPKKAVQANPLFGLPSRLWIRLCENAEINSKQHYADLPKKVFNRFIEMIIRSSFDVKGKTTFKEEFVTCGGVELSEVDLKSYESKKIPGLYFAGEVLNVDGITGGFNFQHAWTSGYLAGKSASISIDK